MPMEPSSPEKPSRAGIAPELSTKLTVMSFLAACSVVVLHAYEKHLAPGISATAWIVTFVGWTLPTFAVSLFFVISGSLVSRKKQKKEVKSN